MKLNDAIELARMNNPGNMTAREIVDFLRKNVSSFDYDDGVSLSKVEPRGNHCYVQINGKYKDQNGNYAVHYEVVQLFPKQYADKLVIRLDDERTHVRVDELRDQLRQLARQHRFNEDPNYHWLAYPAFMVCKEMDSKEVLTRVWNGLRSLYDVFEDTLRRFDAPATTESSMPSTESSMTTEIRHLLESNLQVILTGAPGTGKTYTAKQVAFAMTGDDPKASDHPHIESVQFHPGYDYSDFVIGMKPEIVNGANGSKAVSFDWHDGVFKTFADKAREEYDKAKDKAKAPKFVFLIDEINRSYLSRVFGELFSLLEEEYRYPKNQTGITLPNGEKFHIPANLYIIGTMNDIDRSVESMDFALRRRFAWYEVKAEQSEGIISKKVSDKNAAKNLTIAMQKLNAVIGGEKLKLTNGVETDLRLGTAYQLGGAIFAKFEKCSGKFDALWNNHISNVLGEYLRGRRDREDILKELKGIFDKAVVGVSGGQPSEQNAGDISAPSDQPATPQP